MELYKKSHELGFINPEYKELSYYPEVNAKHLNNYDSEIIDLDPGPIIIFNPLIVHRTVSNLSKNVRFVVGCDIQDLNAIPTKTDKSSMLYKMEQISIDRKRRREKINY